MKAKVKITKEVEMKTLSVVANVRYWEDAEVNGVEDEHGDLIPCREGDTWRPEIDIDSGVITNWKQGTTAKIHYKVCDAGVYTVKDPDGYVWMEINGYVPATMSPADNGYGDYIIMNVDENGKIEDWEFDPSDFETED